MKELYFSSEFNPRAASITSWEFKEHFYGFYHCTVAKHRRLHPYTSLNVVTIFTTTSVSHADIPLSTNNNNTWRPLVPPKLKQIKRVAAISAPGTKIKARFRGVVVSRPCDQSKNIITAKKHVKTQHDDPQIHPAFAQCKCAGRYCFDKPAMQ